MNYQLTSIKPLSDDMTPLVNKFTTRLDREYAYKLLTVIKAFQEYETIYDSPPSSSAAKPPIAHPFVLMQLILWDLQSSRSRLKEVTPTLTRLIAPLRAVISHYANPGYTVYDCGVPDFYPSGTIDIEYETERQLESG